MEFEMDKICRVCLGEGRLTSLFTSDIVSPSLMVMTCTTVKVSNKDGLPSEICSSCLQHLNIAFQFKQLCESSEHQLRKYLDCNLRKKIDPYSSTTAPKHFDNNVSKSTEMFDAVNVVCELLVEHTEKMEKKKIEDQKIVPESTLLMDNEIAINDARDKKLKNTKRINRKINLNKKTFDRTKCKLLKEPEKCYDCGKSFNYSGYLETHLRVHTGEKPYECKICLKKFTQMGSLALHTRTHTGEKPFQCEICSKQFTTSSNLRAHFKIHNQVRDFSCVECSRAFKTSRELAVHAGTHTGIKNKICKICGKGFYKTNYLNAHLKTVHIGEKNYKCSECGKEFSNSSNLTCHYRIHTGEKPFSCGSCNASFNQSSALHRHKKQHLQNGKKRLSTKNLLTTTNIEPRVLDHNQLVMSQESQAMANSNIIIPLDFNKGITFAGCEPNLLGYSKTVSFQDNYQKKQVYIFNA